jgi:hypothetical protein
MGREYSTHGREAECAQDSGGKAGRKETNMKTWT